MCEGTLAAEAQQLDEQWRADAAHRLHPERVLRIDRGDEIVPRRHVDVNAAVAVAAEGDRAEVITEQVCDEAVHIPWVAGCGT